MPRAQDVAWWETFSNDQLAIIDYCVQCHWPVQFPFTWSFGIQDQVLCSDQIPDELRKIVYPQQRDIYVGPRMSKEAEARWQGNLEEIKVGSLIATLADNDALGHPFWIAKVIELIKDENNSKLLSIKVHWYHTTCHNAFVGKYTLEMIPATTGLGAKKRKKNVRHVSTLDLADVDIIVYDFTLTKSGHLRKSIAGMISEKLKGTCQRETRSRAHNPASVGLHLDEDNVLINSDEEDESSHMGTSGSDGEE